MSTFKFNPAPTQEGISGPLRQLVKEVAFEHVGYDQSPQQDVVIRLANGHVVQVSPGLNAINVWFSEKDFEKLNMDKCPRTMIFNMGA